MLVLRHRIFGPVSLVESTFLNLPQPWKPLMLICLDSVYVLAFSSLHHLHDKATITRTTTMDKSFYGISPHSIIQILSSRSPWLKIGQLIRCSREKTAHSGWQVFSAGVGGCCLPKECGSSEAGGLSVASTLFIRRWEPGRLYWCPKVGGKRLLQIILCE
jgi:hypothetical protein